MTRGIKNNNNNNNNTSFEQPAFPLKWICVCEPSRLASRAQRYFPPGTSMRAGNVVLLDISLLLSTFTASWY